jgi:hypothetical protein
LTPAEGLGYTADEGGDEFEDGEFEGSWTQATSPLGLAVGLALLSHVSP